jgi:hypothetical protein
MDIRDILKSFDQLSEATTTTDKGTVHKAGPGGYGNRHGSEDVTDQYGKPIARASLSKMNTAPPVKRGKGRPPKNADSSGEVKTYDSSALSKAMGMGKAPKPTGKPSVKHSLKEYFDHMDEALSEAGLAVQPLPTTPQQQQQKAMAGKPSFLIKDPANPNMPAITTQDPAVVQAAKNGTMSMQKPGAAPTTPGAKPAVGAGSQVAPMGEDQLDELSPQLMKRAVKKADTMMNKNYYDDNHNATYDYANQGSRIQHGMDKRAGKPSEYKKADAYIKSEPGANTAKGHRMPVGMGEGELDEMWGNPYDDDKVDAINAANPPKAPSGQPNRMTPKPATQVASAPRQANTLDHDAWDKFTGRDKVTEKDVGKHNNATTGFDALVRKLTPKYGKESAMKIAGAQLKKMSEAEAPQHFAQSSPLSSNNRGVLEGSVAKQGFVILDPKLMAQIEPMDGTEVENDIVFSNNPNITAKLMAFAKANPNRLKISSSMSDTGGARPAGNQFSQASGPELVEGKKGVNPFAKKDTKKKPDADKDGIPDYAEDGKGPNDTKKKGAAPKKGVNPFAKKDEKKKVKEGMEHHLQAARLEGKSHALRKMPYNCTHDNMEEARCYHDGFKEGLDECYGQMPILGRTAVDEMGSEVGAMASYGARTPAMEDDMYEMDKTSYMKQQAIKTPGNTFKAFGQTMRDSDVLDEFAFESLDKQLNSLLESEEVSEGMTVSISKGQQGAPDSVSVSAQDGEADQLLSIIKSAGMGLFGGDEHNGYGAPQGSTQAPGGIEVVDDHDGMMALMKKLTGGGDMQDSGDYADEEGHEGHSEEGHMHGEEEPCNECGYMESKCQCDHGDEPIVDETESRDQMAYEVAEDNPPDNGSANSTNATQGNDAANQALATADAGEEEVDESEEDHKCEKCHSDPCKCDDEEEKVEEGIYESYANSADDTFEADIDFMTKVITGGLNKQKSTGQTTVPVVAGQKSRMGVDGLGSPMKESNDLLKDYRKLSGL